MSYTCMPPVIELNEIRLMVNGQKVVCAIYLLVYTLHEITYAINESTYMIAVVCNCLLSCFWLIVSFFLNIFFMCGATFVE